MTASLRALLTGILDYAGLFPPAQLPWAEAFQNYLEYHDGSDAWMLGGFVCPAARLKELEQSVLLTVIGRGGANAEALLANWRLDREDIETLIRRHPRVRVGAYEVRLCDELLQPERARDFETMLDASGDQFFEIESGPGWRASVAKLLSILGSKKHSGLKIRCGGTTANAVPTANDIAFVLSSARAAGVAVKLTAGLHHPFRRFDATLGTATHGFLNVLAAGVLGHAHRLEEDALVRILTDENPRHFHFDDNGLWWHDFFAPTDYIVAVRQASLVSFGCCSFDEPRDDLYALGLLSR